MKLRAGLWAFMLALLLIVPTAAQDKKKTVYVDQSFNLSKLLPPPPTADSEEQKRDLAEVLEAQKARTPAQAEHALADSKINVLHFTDVLGQKLTAENLPLTADFLKKVFADSRLLFLASKDVWKRKRPFLASKEVTPVGELPPSDSYPSGHAVFGQLSAIILANMVPEKSAAIFERSRVYGRNRVVLGVHFPTDVEAGQMAATAIAAVMMQNPDFRRDYEAAKAELRKALAL